jgi:hypothetical protein
MKEKFKILFSDGGWIEFVGLLGLTIGTYGLFWIAWLIK